MEMRLYSVRGLNRHLLLGYSNKSGENIEVSIKGRHDPVIVPRAVVVVECMAAITILDMMLVGMTSTLEGIQRFYEKKLK